jgi:hypothetical protein
MLKNNRDKNSQKLSFRLSLSTNWIGIIAIIGLFALIAGIFFTMNSSTHPGLSITGTMFWDSEPAELISVKLCISGDGPGFSSSSYPFGRKDKCIGFEQNAITDASGEYRFFNIPSGKYTIFYKWPDQDYWDIGKTIKESYLVFVKEGSITRVDPIAAYRED